MSNYDQTEGEIPVIRWSNRRRLAWNAFVALIVGTFLYWFILPLHFSYFSLPTTWLGTIGESYSWFASGMTLVIAAYLGFNSIHSKTANRFVGGSSGDNYYPRPPQTPRNNHQNYDEDDSDDDEIYDPNQVSRNKK